MDLSTLEINSDYNDILYVLTLLSSNTNKNIKFVFSQCELNQTSHNIECNLQLNKFPFDRIKFNADHIIYYMIGVTKLSILNVESDFVNNLIQLFESKLKIFDFVGTVTISYNKNIKLYDIQPEITDVINKYIGDYVEKIKNTIIYKCNLITNKNILKEKCTSYKYTKLFKMIFNDDFISPSNFIIHKIPDIKSKLKKFTYGLSECVQFILQTPMDKNNNLCFSGGLLNDIIRDNFMESLQDMDIFLGGNNENKIANINNIILCVKNKFGNDNVFVGYFSSVIYIFVVGIPRILQLVCTNKLMCRSAITTFDYIHLMAYYKNNVLKIKEDALDNTQTLIATCNNSQIKMFRLFKTCKKGYDISSIIDYKNIKINFNDLNKINRTNKQISYYQTTNNLTNTQINQDQLFNIFKVKPFDINAINLSGNFDDYYGATKKLKEPQKKFMSIINNYNLTVDRFNAFSGIMVYGKVLSKLNFNDTNNNLYISLNEQYSDAIINIIKSSKNNFTENYKNNSKFKRAVKFSQFNVPIFNSSTYKLNPTQLNDFLPNIDCTKHYANSGIIIKCKIPTLDIDSKLCNNENYLFVIKINLYFNEQIIGMSFTVQDCAKTNITIKPYVPKAQMAYNDNIEI